MLALLLLAALSPAASATGESGPESAYIIAQDVNGIVTYDEQGWYKVPEFISGQDYLIAVAGENDKVFLFSVTLDGQTSPAWAYSLNSMGGSGSSATASLSSSDYSVSWDTNAFKFSVKQQMGPGSLPPSGSGGAPPSGTGSPPSGGPGGGGGTWTYQDGKLSYTAKNVTYYLTWDGSAFACTTVEADAAVVALYTNGQERGKCIAAQPTAAPWAVVGSGYSAPTYAVETRLTDPEVVWYVDDAKAGTGTSFTATNLGGLTETGKHSVYCVVSGQQGGYYYRETSVTVDFFVCSGVLENSFLIFSDVHEDYENIGKAIEEVMASNDGRIPALVVCTGDWVNGSVGKDYATLRNVYLPKIRGQLGGLDAVYVGGNHDNMAAAVQASIDAGLGATAEGMRTGAGVIFDAGTAAEHGTNSAQAAGLAVYGINYYALETTGGYSYDAILDGLEAFLDRKAADYRGELIIVAAHAGLHVLDNWGGNNESENMMRPRLRPHSSPNFPYPQKCVRPCGLGRHQTMVSSSRKSRMPMFSTPFSSYQRLRMS